MGMRMIALAGAALLLSVSAGTVRAQSPMMQSHMSYQQMLNQQDMMRRSQQFQLMWQARAAQEAERKRRAAGRNKSPIAHKAAKDTKPAGGTVQGAIKKH
jgi:hypothetical protein